MLIAESGPLALLTQPAGPQGPALMLLDVNMPGMSGIEFREAYQQLPAAQQAATVNIMLTTMAARDLARLKELSTAGLVSKSFIKNNVDGMRQLHFQRQLPARA